MSDDVDEAEGMLDGWRVEGRWLEEKGFRLTVVIKLCQGRVDVGFCFAICGHRAGSGVVLK